MALQDMARIEPDLSDSRALATNYSMLSCFSVTTTGAEKFALSWKNVKHISALPALYLHTQDRKWPEARSPSGLGNDQPGQLRAGSYICVLVVPFADGAAWILTTHLAFFTGWPVLGVTIIDKDWRETGS